MSSSDGDARLTTLIFDVDDTLYDVSTGFTAHRNGEVVQQYMVDHLGFPSLEAAKKLRDEYFAKYHATAKALTVAQSDGRFPDGAPKFETKHLAAYWADNLDYSKLGPPKQDLHAALSECPLTLVAFSNGPRQYVKRVLQYLGLFDLFGEDRLFAVDNTLPHCKPEKEAFAKVFEKLGIQRAENCVMLEDSMKNIRQAKALGMKTVLITGHAETGRILPEDRPETSDPSVDISIAKIEDLRQAAPGLWDKENPHL